MFNNLSAFGVRDTNSAIVLWRRAKRERLTSAKRLTFTTGVGKNYTDIPKLMSCLVSDLKMIPKQQAA